MLVLKRQCLSKRRPQIPISSSSSWTNVCDKPLFSKSCFLVIISDRHHHLLVVISHVAAIVLVDLTQVVQWRNVTYRYVSQCHGVTNRCVKISKYLEWRPLLNCQRSREERISLSKLLTPTSKTVGLTFIAKRACANLVSEKVYGSNLISANDPQPVLYDWSTLA